MIPRNPGRAALAVRLIRLPLLLAALAAATPTPAAAADAPLPTTTTLVSSANPAEDGQTLTLSAVVDGPGWPSGIVTFSDYELGPLQSAPVSEGKAVVTIQPLPAGIRLLSADYGGDGTFAPSDGRLTQRVGPPVAAKVVLGADHNPSPPGQGVTLTAGLQTGGGYGMASGTVTFLEGATQLAQMPVSLLATPAAHGGTLDQLSFVASLPAGVHTIDAIYSGDGNLAATGAAHWTEVVGERVATTTTLASTANPSLGGQPAMLTATVAPSTPASRLPSGTLTFRDGPALLGQAPVAGGAGSLAVALLDAGAHALTVAYSGDGDFQGSTSDPLALQVLGVGGGPAPTATALAAGPNPASFGQPVTLKASVAAVSGAATPAGSVYFADESGAVLGGAGLDPGGQAILTTSNLAPGPHRVKAVYAGGNRFAHSSSETVELSVERAQVSISPLGAGGAGTAEGALRLDIAVSGQTGAAPAGSVTFVDQGAVLGTALVQDQGRAQFAVNGLPAGLHRVIAVYNGDVNYASGSTSFTVLVPGAVATSTSLEASQSRLPATHDLRLTATVAATAPASEAPHGPVTFKEGEGVLAVGELDGQGEAGVTLSALPAGTHTIVASFAGNGSLGPSTGTVTVKVLGGDKEAAGDTG
jgi:Big-like domain-containing protein